MQERRNSDRTALLHCYVKEENGDYLFSYKALNLSEEGIFLEGKICTSKHEPFSRVSFSLPNGIILKNLSARIVREVRSGTKRGAAYEFLNLDEHTRLALKKYFCESLLRGSA